MTAILQRWTGGGGGWDGGGGGVGRERAEPGRTRTLANAVSSTSVIQIARGIISCLACSLSPLHCS